MQGDACPVITQSVRVCLRVRACVRACVSLTMVMPAPTALHKGGDSLLVIRGTGKEKIKKECLCSMRPAVLDRVSSQSLSSS